MKYYKKYFGRKFLVPIFLSVVIILSPLGYVSATIDSCQATITPTVIQPNSQEILTFSIKNEGPETIRWIQINRPSDNFIISNVIWSGTSSTSDYQSVMYGGNDIAPGNTGSVALSVHGGENQTSGESWTVQVADNYDGTNTITCSGNLESRVEGERVPDPDTVPPMIDQIKLKNLKPTSVTVTWLTDEPSDSDVTYGESEDYGQDAHDTAMVTTHEVKLSNLSPDTGYHYVITSYDSAGNSVTGDDNTFQTPVLDTSKVVSSDKESKVAAQTQIPLKTIPTEKIAPTIQITTDLTTPQKDTPVIRGVAEDNDAVAGVSYSLDGGKNWLPVSDAQTLGSKKVVFSFMPENLKDGNYDLVMSVIDTSSNQTQTKVLPFIIDRLPPNIGGAIITVGSQVISPDKDNITSSLVGVDQKITLDAVGGPTEITIVTKEVKTEKIQQHFSLTESKDSELWSGIISFQKAGTYQLYALSVDGAGNQTTRVLQTVSVSDAGKMVDQKGPIIQGKISVYALDTETNAWDLWDGESYDQPNPFISNLKGAYGLYLPEGTYYIKAEAKGRQSLVTRRFTFDKPSIVNTDLSLTHKPGFSLGSFYISFPWPVIEGSNVSSRKNNAQVIEQPSIGKTVSDFTLLMTNGTQLKNAQLYGKPTILTFVNSWSDIAPEQLSALKDVSQPYINVVVVGSGESISKLSSFAEASGYTLPLVSDTDNSLIQSLSGITVPTTYFLDRHGVVQKVLTGYLSKQDLFVNVVL